MRAKYQSLSIVLILGLCTNMIIAPFAVVSPVLAAALPLVDDFESGLPAGTDPNGVAVGFVTFNDPNSSVAIVTTAAPPAPLPATPLTLCQVSTETASPLSLSAGQIS